MILQALDACYDLMVKDGQFQVAMPGYSTQGNCQFVIVIDRDGTCLDVYDFREGKRGRQMVVPQQNGRSGKNPPPYFLCENCKYFFGAVYDKPKKTLEDCSSALTTAAELHSKILDGVDDDGARAVLCFFERRLAGETLPIEPTHDFYTSGFAVLKLEGEDGYLHERPAIRQAWENHNNAPETDAILGQCLITGCEDVPLARTHTLLKGVAGGKATGGSLVGFNFKSVESYGKSQSYNAPVSAQAMFRYTTALNALLANEDNRLFIGDMTCIFWAEREVAGDTISVLTSMLSGNCAPEKSLSFSAQGTEQARRILLRSFYGSGVSDVAIENALRQDVYILGLAPNAARLSVRFWYKNTFRAFTEHVVEHLADMEIVKSEKDKPFVPVGDLLKSMAVAGKTDNIPKAMERALLTAITTGDLYPAGVYANILLRIRAEAGEDYAVNHTRAAYIKAYLKRYRRKNRPEKEEEITVALNENSDSTAYQLGRLFSVLEHLQKEAGNKTLRERYFSSASTNPKTVFPNILKLAQNHLSKVGKEKPNYAVFFDKLCGEILDRIEEQEGFPVSLELDQQGMFILGYYHQRQELYRKKEKDTSEATPQEIND